jgi:hypothetical protein
MKKNPQINREELHQMILKTFANEIYSLNPELQNMLVDDLVTAFQNRFHFFQKIQNKVVLKSQLLSKTLL